MGILVRRRDYETLAWSAPMRELAALAGMTNTGLKNQLVKAGLSIPPQGYWNKVRAGKPVPKPPRRGAVGDTDEIEVDGVFAWLLKPSPPTVALIPAQVGARDVSAGAGQHLEAVRAKALKAIGAGYGVLSRGPLHPSINELLAIDRDLEPDVGQWRPSRPAFTTPLSLRQLALLSALYRTLEKRGVRCFANVWSGRLHARAANHGIEVSIDTAILRGRRASSWRKLLSEQADAPPTARLIFKVSSGETWADDEAGPLEAKIPSIAAGVIVALELGRLTAARREQEQREQASAARQAVQAAEAAEVARAAEAERVAVLRRHAAQSREAEDIRRLVVRVQTSARQGNSLQGAAEIRAWCAWAMLAADRLDPILSGELLAFAPPPAVEGS